MPSLVASASGTVLEIGPGSGNQLPRYDKTKTNKIYGIEPNAELHDALRKSIKKAGLSDIYNLVPCGIEDEAELKRFGVEKGGIDSLLSVQVLCSVPRPKEVVAQLYGLLKPGGQLIVYEHTSSDDRLSRTVQGRFSLHLRVLGHC